MGAREEHGPAGAVLEVAGIAGVDAEGRHATPPRLAWACSRIQALQVFPDPAMKSRQASILALVLRLALLACAGCHREKEGGKAAAASPRAPRHVFFITVDTLRADHMSLYGYGRAHVAEPREGWPPRG